MWWFKKKAIPMPHGDVGQQVAFALKSLTLPQSLPNWKMFASTNSKWNIETAINEGYNASAIVYACIEKRASLIASVPWVVKEKKGDAWEDIPNHPLQLLINNPNLDQSWYELIYAASQNLDLAGSAFISEVRAGTKNLPQELWCLPSKYMCIKPGNVRLVDHYESKHTGVKSIVQRDDMIHLKKPNPNDPIWGMPVLMAAGRATDIDRESGIWQKVSLENRGATDVNIKLPESVTAEQAEMVKKSYQEQQAGPKNARKAFISNAEIQQLGQTAVELDFVTSRRAIWTEICAVFGMSLANLGMTEAVNLANAEAMNKALWENTIIPQLELMQRQFNHQLAREYGHNIKMVPDLSNVKALQEGLSNKVAVAKELYQMGVPFSDINAKLELGFDDREEYKVSYISSSIIPASYDSINMGDENDSIDDASDAYGEGVLSLQADEKPQDSALNGSQISSLSAITQSVTDGLASPDAAIALIMIAFPTISRESAAELINSAAAFTPKVEDV